MSGSNRRWFGCRVDLIGEASGADRVGPVVGSWRKGGLGCARLSVVVDQLMGEGPAVVDGKINQFILFCFAADTLR